MNDCVAAATATVAAYSRRKQRIKIVNQLVLVPRGRYNRGSRTHLYPLQCVSYSSHVLGTDYMLLETACTV